MGEAFGAEKIGFVGLGNMGAPLAQKLAAHGPVTVFDLSEACAAKLASADAAVAGSAKEVALHSSIVFTCLPTSAHVRTALFSEDGIAAGLCEGGMVVDMTTGNPDDTREMSAQLAHTNRHLIDAPVSGGPRGAQEGTIAIMIGGSDAEAARVRPILGLITKNAMHAGPVGAGHAVKAGNNLLNLICRMATFEVVSMLVKEGVAPDKAVEIISRSSGRSYASEITLPDNILSGKMNQGFTTALMRKDASVALAMAERLGLEMPLGREAMARLAEVIEEHSEDADMSATALTYERLTGARIRP